MKDLAPIDDRSGGRRLRVVHLITGMIDAAGAQTMLWNLVSRSNREAFDHEVISLKGIGPIGEKIRAAGLSMRTLGMLQGLPDPVSFWRLVRWLRARQPDLVQTWMYHADLMGGLAAPLAGKVPVVWNIRHSELDSPGHKRLTRWTAMACARLSSRLPSGIVCCAETSRRLHAQLGYDTTSMEVIPNGFDIDLWRPDPAARAAVRRELDVPEDALLIGRVGRFHPLKDYPTFFAAAGRLKRSNPDVWFVLCGDGVTAENEEVAALCRAAAIGDRCRLLGHRRDAPRLVAAMDVATSCSYSEGFPNVIGEAMACEVPCVVTDVGDSWLIVGDAGVVVPPRDPGALEDGWRRLLELGAEGRRRLGKEARERIAARFEIGRICDRYEGLYRALASGRRPGEEAARPGR